MSDNRYSLSTTTVKTLSLVLYTAQHGKDNPCWYLTEERVLCLVSTDHCTGNTGCGRLSCTQMVGGREIEGEREREDARGKRAHPCVDKHGWELEEESKAGKEGQEERESLFATVSAVLW